MEYNHRFKHGGIKMSRTIDYLKLHESKNDARCDEILHLKRNPMNKL